MCNVDAEWVCHKCRANEMNISKIDNSGIFSKDSPYAFQDHLISQMPREPVYKYLVAAR